MVEALRFSRSLYDPPAVHAAIAAYAELAHFELIEHEAETVVEVSGYEHANLPDAFANHVLFETIRRLRARNVEVAP